jgi:threonylcarbamoyladenosine tRNA methylthiotransferase MtaB
MTEDPPAQPRAALHSVGCKLNQFETELLRQALEDRGYRIVALEEPADVYILNSCTVTSRTDRECRRLARGAKARNPHAYVVMTGCYAEVSRDDLADRGLADLLVGNRDKSALPDLIDAALGRASLACTSGHLPPLPQGEGELGDSTRQRPYLPPLPQGEGAGGEAPLLREFRGHTRAFVKVQEGCAGGCSYCIIARARGPESSVPSAQVVEQVRLLARRHPEIVLIGTHLGRYGRDLTGEVDLADLVELLCDLPELGRLRLSSLEPLEVTPALQDLVVAGGLSLASLNRPGHGKVCRHLHLPLQSGADSVLRRMGRPYRAEAYAALVTDLRRRQPGLALGADVMVGFPGETEAEFEETRRLLEALPLAYLHVFTFSPRPGTPAAEMPGQVPGQVKKERNHLLRALSDRKRAEFAAGQVGATLEVVSEAGQEGESYGLSDNYLRVALPSDAVRFPGVRAVRVIAAAGACLQGSPSVAET